MTSSSRDNETSADVRINAGEDAPLVEQDAGGARTSTAASASASDSDSDSDSDSAAADPGSSVPSPAETVCPDDLVVSDGAVEAHLVDTEGELASEAETASKQTAVATDDSATAPLGPGTESAGTGTTADAAKDQAAADEGRREARKGVIYGIAAFGLWGIFPAFFKLLQHISPWEVLAHRIIWSLLFLLVLIGINQRRRETAVGFLQRDRALLKRTLPILFITAVLIAANWGIFIWATVNDRILQASLGYFINPLVSVLLGFIFLRERLSLGQTAGVLIATVAVTWLTISYGVLPWVALTLAFSFGFYGLLRKVAHVDAMTGLAVETALLAPIAVGYLMLLQMQADLAFANEGAWITSLLVAAGVLTAIPLLFFTNAAKRLRLGTVGLLQYIAPTGHFLLAVVVYDEAFDQDRAIAFLLIWIALGIYTFDSLKRQRKQRRGL
ncbi:MAG: EamA family transporter RarD [Planctomycetota bacterium]